MHPENEAALHRTIQAMETSCAWYLCWVFDLVWTKFSNGSLSWDITYSGDFSLNTFNCWRSLREVVTGMFIWLALCIEMLPCFITNLVNGSAEIRLNGGGEHACWELELDGSKNLLWRSSCWLALGPTRTADKIYQSCAGASSQFGASGSEGGYRAMQDCDAMATPLCSLTGHVFPKNEGDQGAVGKKRLPMA